MLVFRLEHEIYGCGPYRINEEMELLSSEEYLSELDKFTDVMCEVHNGSTDHPIPNITVNHVRDYIFGFSSLEELKDWFHGYLYTLMYDFGFIIQKYETDDYQLFNKQLIFKKDTATRLDEVIITSKRCLLIRGVFEYVAKISLTFLKNTLKSQLARKFL